MSSAAVSAPGEVERTRGTVCRTRVCYVCVGAAISGADVWLTYCRGLESWGDASRDSSSSYSPRDANWRTAGAVCRMLSAALLCAHARRYVRATDRKPYTLPPRHMEVSAVPAGSIEYGLYTTGGGAMKRVGGGGERVNRRNMNRGTSKCRRLPYCPPTVLARWPRFW